MLNVKMTANIMTANVIRTNYITFVFDLLPVIMSSSLSWSTGLV